MDLRILGLVFLGHYYIDCWIFADLGVGVGVWLGPAFTKLLVRVFEFWVCFPWFLILSRVVVIVVGFPARILRTV